MIKIEIRTGNSAFTAEENGIGWEYEVARILKELANKIENGSEPTKLMDYNGNSVGKVEYNLD